MDSNNIDFPVSWTFRRGLSDDWTEAEERAYKAAHPDPYKMDDAAFLRYLDEWWREELPPSPPRESLRPIPSPPAPPAKPRPRRKGIEL